MPTVYGVTPQGFRRKTLIEIVDEIEVDELAEIANDLDVSAEAVVGQMNGIFGRQLSIAWEQLETCYHGFDPDATEGRLLEMLCKLTGTYRHGETASEVVLTCDLDNGTTLLPGVHFASIEDKPDIRWTPSKVLYPSGYTAVGDGLKPVTFVAELTGPIVGLAGTINVISTQLTGWKTVVNPDDAELGIRVDNDPGLRARRERELATIGSATVRAITANISQAFGDKITNLTVYENEGDNVDDNGLPPHCIEALIFDGDVPSVENNALAQVILDSKAGGIQTSGNTTGTATALVNGVESTLGVKFSRAAQLPVYLIINLVKKLNVPYLGDAKVAEYVATQGNAYFAPGDEIIEDRIRAFVLACAGVKDITSVFLGLSANPTASDNIPITIRQIGRFSTSRIIVNVG
jgi:uncharacterized phage protein gp47/JayE